MAHRLCDSLVLATKSVQFSAAQSKWRFEFEPPHRTLEAEVRPRQPPQLQMRPPLKDGIDGHRLCIHVDTALKRTALREGSPRQAFHRTVPHVARPRKRHGVGRQLVRGDLHVRCIELVGHAVHFAHELSEGKRAVQGSESTGRVVVQLATGVHLSGHGQHGLKFVGDARKPRVEGGARIERGRAIPLEVGAGQGTKGTVKGPPRSLSPELVRGPLPLALGVGHGAFGGAHALHGHGEASPSRGHLKGIFGGGPSGIDAPVGPGGFEVHAVVECDLALPRWRRPNSFDGALAQGGDGDGPSFEFLTASCPCPTDSRPPTTRSPCADHARSSPGVQVPSDDMSKGRAPASLVHPCVCPRPDIPLTALPSGHATVAWVTLAEPGDRRAWPQTLGCRPNGRLPQSRWTIQCAGESARSVENSSALGHLG